MNGPGLPELNRLVIVDVIGLPLSIELFLGPVILVKLLGAMFELPVVDTTIFIGVTVFKAKLMVTFPVILVAELGHVQHGSSSREANYQSTLKCFAHPFAFKFIIIKTFVRNLVLSISNLLYNNFYK